jgi:hypothetical protein
MGTIIRQLQAIVAVKTGTNSECVEVAKRCLVETSKVLPETTTLMRVKGLSRGGLAPSSYAFVGIRFATEKFTRFPIPLHPFFCSRIFDLAAILYFALSVPFASVLSHSSFEHTTYSVKRAEQARHLAFVQKENEGV